MTRLDDVVNEILEIEDEDLEIAVAKINAEARLYASMASTPDDKNYHHKFILAKRIILLKLELACIRKYRDKMSRVWERVDIEP